MRLFSDEQVGGFLATLPPIEEHLLCLRYGLPFSCFSDGTCHTLAEIAQQLNWSVPRISRILARAQAKLADPARLRKLEAFLAAQGVS